MNRNPFDRFDIPKKEKSLPKPLGDEQRDRLLTLIKNRYVESEDVRDLQAVVMIELGLKAGFRNGAMRNMLWEGTDLRSPFLTVFLIFKPFFCRPWDTIFQFLVFHSHNKRWSGLFGQLKAVFK